MSIGHLFEDIIRDVRYGARVLVRNPLFSAVAIASLAIGIGGASSVFTVLNAVLLRSLPVANPQQLFVAEKVRATDRHGRYSWPAFERARTELESHAEACAFTSTLGMQLRPGTGDAIPPERGMVQLVSGEFFAVLRQQPQAGRLLLPDDNARIGGHPVAVISDAYWDRHFQRSPAAVGQTIVVNGASFTIVGVAPRGFFGPILAIRNPDVWVPLVMQQEVRYAANASSSTGSDLQKPWASQEAIEWLAVLVRVADPAKRGTATSILTAQFQRDSLGGVDPANTSRRADIERERVELETGGRGISGLRRDLTMPLYVLLGMVGVLLVIACGNLASLLISRANAREREMAIRLSIGAGRTRVIRQLLAETMLLASVGGALGMLLAAWGRDILLGMFATGAASIDLDTSFDWRVIGFAIAVTFATGLLAGVGPAVRGTRVSLAEAMKTQARSVGSGARAAFVGRALVVAQIAFCLLLLVVAALFTRSMQSLLRVDVGYDRSHLLVGRMDPRSVGYTDEQRQALYDRLLDRLRALPGVEGASFSLNGPLGTSQRTSSLAIEGHTPADGEQLLTNEEVVTGGYFETVGLRIIAGRGFTTADRAEGVQNTVVNQTFATRFFPQGDAVGKRWDYGDEISRTSPVIVGVVEDASYRDIRETPPLMVYHLAAATPTNVLTNFELRTAMSPALLAATVRRTLAEADPALPVFDIVPLDDRLHRGISYDRLVARLTTAFGVVALMLACLGLYGTISYGVTRRVTELGVRMALGAARGHVLWLIIREAGLLVLAGATIGIPLAVLAGRSVDSLLYQVPPIDPLSFGLAAVALFVVCGLAAFLPAHRASRIDPMAALRKD